MYVHQVFVYIFDNVDNHHANEFQVSHLEMMDHLSVIYNQNIQEMLVLKDKKNQNIEEISNGNEDF